MESNRNLTKDTKDINRTSGSVSGSTGSIGSPSSTGSHNNPSTGSAPQRAKDTAQSTIDQTKQAVNDAYGKTTEVLGNAYEKTSEVLGNTYDKTMTYGRENPGTLTLIAFGAGIGVGLLLASSLGGGRSRTSRIAEPIVGALSQIALEYLR
jgi:ElaB/YqjD/DUF883 family membrane-anchored ribosome-binding protein